MLRSAAHTLERPTVAVPEGTPTTQDFEPRSQVGVAIGAAQQVPLAEKRGDFGGQPRGAEIART